MDTQQIAPRTRFWRNVAGELRLHSSDLWQLALIPFGITVFVGLILTAVLFFVDDTDAPAIVGLITSGAPVGVAAFVGILVSGTFFSVYYKLGIQMGQTRRNMLLRLSILSLAEQTVLIGCALGFSSAITWFYKRFISQGEYLFANVPWWGWVAMIIVPLALGVFGAAVLMRFGRKGFWALYAIFMVTMLGPQLFPGVMEGFVNAFADALIDGVVRWADQLPMVLCVVCLVPYAIGVALLWRLPIKN